MEVANAVESPVSVVESLLPVVQPVICTLGSAEQEVPHLLALMRAGMTIARLDFSKGTQQQHLQMIRNVRAAEALYEQGLGHPPHIAIALDLQPAPEAAATETDSLKDGIVFAAAQGFDMIMTASHKTSEQVDEIRNSLGEGQVLSIVVKIHPDHQDVADVARAADGVMIDGEEQMALQFSRAHGVPVFWGQSGESFALVDPRTGVQPESIPVHIDQQLPADVHVILAFNVSVNSEDVKAIVVLTKTGETVRSIASYRPPCQIVAVVDDVRVARQMRLLHGVIPFSMSSLPVSRDWTQDDWNRDVVAVKQFLSDKNIAKQGDRIIILTGADSATGAVGSRNVEL